MVDPIDTWYRITLTSNGTGGTFDLVYLVRREDHYTGDATELCSGQVNGHASLTAIGEGIAQALIAQGAPVLDNVTIKSLEAIVPAALAPVTP